MEYLTQENLDNLNKQDNPDPVDNLALMDNLLLR